jgi:hypothetical protein
MPGTAPFARPPLTLALPPLALPAGLTPSAPVAHVCCLPSVLRWLGWRSIDTGAQLTQLVHKLCPKMEPAGVESIRAHLAAKPHWSLSELAARLRAAEELPPVPEPTPEPTPVPEPTPELEGVAAPAPKSEVVEAKAAVEAQAFQEAAASAATAKATAEAEAAAAKAAVEAQAVQEAAASAATAKATAEAEAAAAKAAAEAQAVQEAAEAKAAAVPTPVETAAYSRPAGKHLYAVLLDAAQTAADGEAAAALAAAAPSLSALGPLLAALCPDVTPVETTHVAAMLAVRVAGMGGEYSLSALPPAPLPALQVRFRRDRT